MSQQFNQPSIKGIAITLGMKSVLLSPVLLYTVTWGSYYWGYLTQDNTIEQWSGCAAPASASAAAEWKAHSEATGEPLCEPGIIIQHNGS